MSIYPRRGPINTDDLCARDQPAAAEGRQVSQPSAKTVARGYGARHKALRKRWAAEVARGEVCCARCGYVIWPEQIDRTYGHLLPDSIGRARTALEAFGHGAATAAEVGAEIL
jgi:hypothetical protein